MMIKRPEAQNLSSITKFRLQWIIECKTQLDMSKTSAHGDQYEQEHVHDVYEQIAEHFSSTRYKPWPIVERFLKDLPDGSVGLDIGTGNGKYLAVNRNIFIVGSDRSTNLISVACRHQPHSVLVAEILDLPHPADYFDFVICIAVIHHLSTDDRRVQAIDHCNREFRPEPREHRSHPQCTSIDGTHRSGGNSPSGYSHWQHRRRHHRVTIWNARCDGSSQRPWIGKGNLYELRDL